MIAKKVRFKERIVHIRHPMSENSGRKPLPGIYRDKGCRQLLSN